MAGSTEAISALRQRGAHLVLVRPSSKVPAWRGYQSRNPGIETIDRHRDAGGLVGIIPWSIGCTALDVDAGNPQSVIAQIGDPRAALDSMNREGAHLYYDDTAPRRNVKFQIAGCAGDVRSGNGFLVLLGDQAIRLYDAITADGRYELQADLVDLVQERNRTTKSGLILPDVGAEIDWSAVRHGYRNHSLFHAGRKLIYPMRPGDDLDAWIVQCNETLAELNRQIADPLDRREVARIAGSIAGWTFNRFGHVDHGLQIVADYSALAQRRRAIKRWHGNARKTTLAAIVERNGYISDLCEAGLSQRAIAGIVGLSAMGVNRVIHTLPTFGLEAIPNPRIGRRERVRERRNAGQSLRQIAAAEGVAVNTVRADLAAL